MANVKFISIFMAILSLVIVLMATQACNAFGSATDEVLDNPIFWLFDLQTIPNTIDSCQAGQVNPIDNVQANLTANFSNSANQLVTPAAGSTGTFGDSVFYDPLKLIGGIGALVLGLPVYTFLYSIGLSTAVATILTVFLACMQIFGLVEFYRGGSL